MKSVVLYARLELNCRLLLPWIWAFEWMNYDDTKFELSKGWTMMIPNLSFRRRELWWYQIWVSKGWTMLIPNLSFRRDELWWHQIWSFEGMSYADTKFEPSKGWNMPIPNLSLRIDELQWYQIYFNLYSVTLTNRIKLGNRIQICNLWLWLIKQRY
jgi:hypothetical protein